MLHDNEYTIDRAQQAHEEMLSILFRTLNEHHVYLEGIIMKQAMVLFSEKNKPADVSPQVFNIFQQDEIHTQTHISFSLIFIEHFKLMSHLRWKHLLLRKNKSYRNSKSIWPKCFMCIWDEKCMISQVYYRFTDYRWIYSNNITEDSSRGRPGNCFPKWRTRWRRVHDESQCHQYIWDEKTMGTDFLFCPCFAGSHTLILYQLKFIALFIIRGFVAGIDKYSHIIYW